MIYLSTETYNENDKIVKKIKFLDKELIYKFPISEKDNITNRLDPFVYALIFPMMEIGGDFYFDGDISISVLDNVEQFCKIWNVWCKDLYKPIVIHANEIDDEYRPHDKKAILSFSGGLDAAYTAYKYKNNLAGRRSYDLDKCVMIHGADIPLKDKEQFQIAFKNAKIMTDDLGIDLIPVETNYREIFNSNWEHCFCSFIAAVLSFFSSGYSIGLSASGSSVNTARIRWGQTPAIDPYLSSVNFKFIVDGYEHTRTERAGLIKNWEKGINNLRVCWRNEDKSKNCSICEKCIRTKLNFLVNGINNIDSMDTQFNYKELNNLRVERHLLVHYQEILDYAKEHQSLSKDNIKNWKIL